jgi:hypothetical protein
VEPHIAYVEGTTLTAIFERHSQWCAVTDKGDIMAWECEYGSSDEYAAAIAGSGGQCAINSYRHSDPSSNGH